MVRREELTSPINPAPCFIHVRLSSGINADAFSDVSHLYREGENTKQSAVVEEVLRFFTEAKVAIPHKKYSNTSKSPEFKMLLK